MKGLKYYVCALSAAMLLSGCGMTNMAKGGLIGGSGGGALGAGLAALIGHNKGKAAAIGGAHLFYYQKFRVGYKRHHNVTLLQSRKI